MALLAIALMLQAAGCRLSLAGQMMMPIQAFAMIVWMTAALDYAISAVGAAALMIFVLALVPDAAKPGLAERTRSLLLILTNPCFSHRRSRPFQRNSRVAQFRLPHPCPPDVELLPTPPL